MESSRCQSKTSRTEGAYIVAFWCLLLLFPSVLMASHPPLQRTYVIGVYPHLSSAHLENTFGAIADHLREITGERYEFSVASSLQNFTQDLDAGRYDLVFLQPFDYVKAKKKHGYEILVAQDRPLKVVFLVRQGSDIKTIADMRGKKMLFPPESTAVSYVASDWLIRNGLLPGKDLQVVYESTHVSCMYKVMIRFADVCATVSEAPDFIKDKLGIQLRSVGESDPLPHALFAVSSRVPDDLRSLIRRGLIALSASESGKRILADGRLSAFRQASDSEYDAVREILQRREK